MLDINCLVHKVSWFFRLKRLNREITFFDVKELYNLAYEQKAQARNALRKFRRIEAQAKAMDEAYRAQLGLVRRIA